MKIKSAKDFRLRYRTHEKEIELNNKSYNQDFIGTYHEKDGRKIKGFFEMYHGHKPDIPGYLPSMLKIAEDGQAIYEFLQNAVDCGSTHFYIFYNEDYFLAINNGTPFEVDGLKSLLNIAQSTKTDADKIGRFGIGFKLAHRLVGKNEGVEELTHDYKGPVLFSWSRSDDLKKLIANDKIEPVSSCEYEDYLSLPYLMKLVLTNFPADPNEVVKDLNYDDNVIFPQSELDELTAFLKDSFNRHPDILDIKHLNQGSLFFIKLGKGKKEYLDKDYNELVNGIQYSMNMLKNLEHVYINDDNIKKIELQLDKAVISNDSEAFKRISPEYKDYDIKYSIGYPKINFGHNNAFHITEMIKKSPNIYKYFPMGDETNGFGFILHCDSFSNEANRRKLQHDEVNKNLFPEIASFIKDELNKHMNEANESYNRKGFLNLYASILVSNIPDKQNNEWLNTIFFSSLLDYITTNIPTHKGYSNRSENVKINNLEMDLDLADFGLDYIEWFEWDKTTERILIEEAKSKLGIKEWDIRDVIENSDLESINNWIENCDSETYNTFIKKLEKSGLRSRTKDKIKEIRLFRFSNGKYYSFNDIIATQSYNGKTVLKPVGALFGYPKITEVKDILIDLGIAVSDINVTDYPEIMSSIMFPDDKVIYNMIVPYFETNKLSPDSKRRLFLNFTSPRTKFNDVGNETLKSIKLFNDVSGNIKPVSELLDSNLNVPDWLKVYTIRSEENFPELKYFLIEESEIYSRILFKKWDEIITTISDAHDFYVKVRRYFSLDKSDIAGLDSKSVVCVDNNEFVVQNLVFYNPSLNKLENKYINFKDSIQSLTTLLMPNQSIIDFLKEKPFRIERRKFTDLQIDSSINLYFEDIKSILSFCKYNEELFFNKFIIRNNNDTYNILNKTEDLFQVRTSDKDVENFIEENLSDTLVLLPKELYPYISNESGIIQREDLYSLILEKIEIQDYKEELLDIIVDSEYRRELILMISDIVLISNYDYDVESYEYKLLKFACDDLKDEDYSEFRSSITIQNENVTLLANNTIRPIDKIKIKDVEFNLSQLVPDEFRDNGVLSELIANFVGLGLNENKLKKIFGIDESPSLAEIYKHISNGYTVLNNAQQLAFVLLYSAEVEGINLDDFQVETLDGHHELSYPYYIKRFPFINENSILHDKYNGMEEFLNLPFTLGKSQIIREPYFSEGELICPYLLDEISDEKKVVFFEFLYGFWSKDDESKVLVRSCDWSKVNNLNTKDVFNFNPSYSVYPNEFACEKEELPNYLLEWIENDASKITFMSDLGVWTDSSVVVRLRRYLRDGGVFDINLEREEKFDTDGEMLYNSINWLVDNNLTLKTRDKFNVFKKVVELINNHRDNNNELSIRREFNTKSIQESSTEWETDYYLKWKQTFEKDFLIYLHNGKMPKMIKLSEFEEYVFYTFDNDNYYIGDNSVYINKNIDTLRALESIISDVDSAFAAKDLVALYSVKDNGSTKDYEIEALKEENERLRQRIIELETPIETAQYSPTVSYDNPYHHEIQKLSEQYVYDHLTKSGCKIEWLNYDELEGFKESYEQYDFKILSNDREVLHYIDCKGTYQEKKTFYLSHKEWDFFLSCVKNNLSYQIYRVFNVSSTPYHVHIDSLWEWIREGKVVPYLLKTESIDGRKVFLTLV